MRAQSCPTLQLCIACNPPGSSVHGIYQASALEWVASPAPWDLLSRGLNPRSIVSPALAGVSTDRAAWEAKFLPVWELLPSVVFQLPFTSFCPLASSLLWSSLTVRLYFVKLFLMSIFFSECFLFFFFFLNAVCLFYIWWKERCLQSSPRSPQSSFSQLISDQGICITVLYIPGK